MDLDNPVFEKYKNYLNFEKEKTIQKRSKRIINFPKVLIFHINQVVYDDFGNAFKKYKPVEYPLRLNMGNN